jgi:Carbamoyl-phosphate synthase L chain, ATP binding domain
MGNQPEALIVGSSSDILWGLPDLLSRAGFAVDAIATARTVRLSKFIRTARVPESFEEMIRLAHEEICARAIAYDWIIPGEDATLKALSELEWPEERRPGFLCMAGSGQPSQFYSKIGLSRILSTAGIPTPAFRVASTQPDAVAAANEIGYPAMLKIDASFGGLGVRECQGEADILKFPEFFQGRPLLVQKAVKGREIYIDAIYVRGKLAHFAYSWPLRSQGRFGPSILREYWPLPLVDEQVFDELTALGEALGADGFVNVTCIDAEDGTGRYYIEADMRPNIWMDFARYFGEDPAERIRKGFSGKAYLTAESVGSAEGHRRIVIPHFLRMSFWELVLNRYRVWGFIPLADPRVAFRVLAAKIYWRAYCRGCAMLSGGLKTMVKRRIAAIGRALAYRRAGAGMSGDMLPRDLLVETEAALGAAGRGAE